VFREINPLYSAGKSGYQENNMKIFATITQQNILKAEDKSVYYGE
jgi:hypothetical protein